MSYYAIIVPPFVGHLNPLIVLARALQNRGHRVAFISPLDSEERVAAAGFEFIPVATKEFPRGAWDRMTERNAELTGFAATRFVCRSLAELIGAMMRELPEIAAREKIDGLIMDPVCPGMEGVCQVIGLPMAVACAALIFHAEPGAPPPTFTWPPSESLASQFRNVLAQLRVFSTALPVIRRMAAYRFKHRLAPMGFYHGNELPPSLVQVSQQPAFFDFPRKHLPDHFHYTGPWLDDAPRHEPDFPWERLDSRPLIYATMGTLQNRLHHVFRIIAEACAGLNGQLVLALGSKTASIPANLPGDPIVVPYAPQRALLKRATLVVTHAGLNTTLEALRERLPIVALPVTNDQPGVSARLKHLGLGEFIPAATVTAEPLRALIQRVLNTPSYRERARWAGDQIAQCGGAAQAAELIERAFTTRQRIRAKPLSSLLVSA